VIGRLLGHYRVLKQLGSGGMGDVYVAEDTRLDRRVAIKVPRADVAGSPDRRVRFRREAKAAAALNHPNIVHLYSVEEHEGVLFLTMELVEGRSLREILSAGTPLAVPRAVAFGIQMAEALACAHAAGILHRDLKPANVMITANDRVKILDFGLAKLFAPSFSGSAEAATVVQQLTSEGTALGTAGYMSPEQALGRPVDPRTDLFALGVVLFEMTTGQAPFPGDTVFAVLDQLLHRRPPSVRAVHAAVPDWLASVIERTLEKDPDRRYGSVNDLLEDLRRVDSSGIPARAPSAVHTDARRPSSIVVLPFVDLSPGRDQEYFCHGLTEEIIATLTRVPGLRVISRTSAFAFQGQGLEITEIGRRLGVGTALEGSVRKAGERVRITTQLVNAESGYQMWSKRFDRDLADVFAIQDEIAANIVKELREGLAGAPQWLGPSQNRLAESFDRLEGLLAQRVDLEAHDAYLKGMYVLNKWTDQSVPQAIDHFREAIALAPRFAPAHAALAEAHIWLYSGLGILPASETVPQARRAVETALELDPNLADAHKVRALIAMNHDWDRRGAEEGLSRALELGPGSAAAHLWNAWRLALLERQHERAIAELHQAERLDPLDLQLKTQIGYVHYFHHDLDRAIEQFERVLGLEPAFAFAHYALGDVCAQKGDLERAIAEFERAIALGGRSVNHIGVLGYAHARAGNRDRANSLLQELMARSSERYVSAMWVALVHLGLSDHESLFRWLDRAFDERDGSLILITAAVEFDPVREDPRFKSLLGRMGLGYLASPPIAVARPS
jgi:serine/threonine protein kinase/tetratricopeptide (TPR) repeat protein